MFASEEVYPDPIDRYLAALERARDAGIDTAPAALATADASRQPSVRVVLVRRVDGRGFVFFTNYGSRKARELTENPRASLCQYWPAIDEQIRVEGAVEIIDPAESDAYFAGRPRESQIGAWASDQSQELESRSALETRYTEVAARFDGQPVTRPPFWGGFRIAPDVMEFWYARPGRLHERLEYRKARSGWATRWLNP